MLVARFASGGGVITFCKSSPATYVHTLNTQSGLERKLECLGIPMTLPVFEEGTDNDVVRKNQKSSSFQTNRETDMTKSQVLYDVDDYMI